MQSSQRKENLVTHNSHLIKACAQGKIDPNFSAANRKWRQACPLCGNLSRCKLNVKEQMLLYRFAVLQLFYNFAVLQLLYVPSRLEKLDAASAPGGLDATDATGSIGVSST